MTSTRVFIGRLPHVARESDVERFFKGYGKIREISLKEGYGFVVSRSRFKLLGIFITNLL